MFSVLFSASTVVLVRNPLDPLPFQVTASGGKHVLRWTGSLEALELVAGGPLGQ